MPTMSPPSSRPLSVQGESDLRFGEDQRLLEVRRLLSSAYPVVVKAGNSQDTSDPEVKHGLRHTNPASDLAFAMLHWIGD